MAGLPHFRNSLAGGLWAGTTEDTRTLDRFLNKDLIKRIVSNSLIYDLFSCFIKHEDNKDHFFNKMYDDKRNVASFLSKQSCANFDDSRQFLKKQMLNHTNNNRRGDPWLSVWH